MASEKTDADIVGVGEAGEMFAVECVVDALRRV